MPSPLDEIERTLPKYLSPENAKQLADALKQFPNSMPYYAAAPPAGMWQGDVFSGVLAFNGSLTPPLTRRGRFMAIANTCDMAAENERQFGVNAVMASVTTLAKFRNLLLENGIAQKQIDSTIDSLRLQRKTSVFFLPGGGGGPSEDMLVFLDDVHSQNIDQFRNDGEKQRDFSLSQPGWYLLLVKLAIHFCRAFEGEPRPTPATAQATTSPSTRTEILDRKFWTRLKKALGLQ
jgi:hypothetical protein